ncbi:MAG: hypothetical protein CSA58_01615 [Micrococcales bacterium]|nr:MAG: hypothetical protein CSB46_02410 [Micrococcales bacterium]PIE27937.1 MAG: hypothetical protein CSA58_01615 [Micrococcales bacterium]
MACRFGSATVLAVGALTVCATVTCGPAHATTDDVYRYWGYYHLQDDTWAYADTGAGQFTPKDGAVEGWRYALGAGDAPRTPRDVLSFEEICADTPASDGEKRVGVVIDYGRAVDASDGANQADVPEPVAECVVADESANGAQLLAAAEQVSEGDNGLVCAIDGYPKTGCDAKPVPAADVPQQATAADEPVDIEVTSDDADAAGGDAAEGEAAESAEETDTGSGVPGWVAGLAGLGAVAAIVALVAGRRRQAQLIEDARRQAAPDGTGEPGPQQPGPAGHDPGAR